MSEETTTRVGTIVWQDLTVPNAEQVRDFYQAVVGWESRPEDMEGYEDYHMIPPGSQKSAAGVCHARGTNAGVPPQWLVYVLVEDVERSAARRIWPPTWPGTSPPPDSRRTSRRTCSSSPRQTAGSSATCSSGPPTSPP